MTSSSLIIEEDNLSVAWARAFLSVMVAGEIAPLIVVIRGFDNGEPAEVEATEPEAEATEPEAEEASKSAQADS